MREKGDIRMEVVQVNGKVVIPCVFTGECTREDEGRGCGTCPDYYKALPKKETQMDIISRYPVGLVGVVGFTKEELVRMLEWFNIYNNETSLAERFDIELRDKIRGVVKEMEGD